MSSNYYEFQFYVNGTYMKQRIDTDDSYNAKKQLYTIYPNAQHVTSNFVDMDRINANLEMERKRKREFEEKKYQEEQEEKFRKYKNEIERRFEQEEEKIRAKEQKEFEELRKIEQKKLFEYRYNNLSLEEKLFLENSSKKLEKLKKINYKIIDQLISYCFFICIKVLIVYFAFNYLIAYYSNKLIFSFNFSNIIKIIVILFAIVYIVSYIRYFINNVILNYYELFKYFIFVSLIASSIVFNFEKDIKYIIYFFILLNFIVIIESPISNKNKRFKKIQKLRNETSFLVEKFKKDKGLFIEEK